MVHDGTIGSNVLNLSYLHWPVPLTRGWAFEYVLIDTKEIVYELVV